ncbi:MAG: hypothetical protein ACK5TK_02275 [Betaproteobacteria bacterium]
MKVFAVAGAALVLAGASLLSGCALTPSAPPPPTTYAIEPAPGPVAGSLPAARYALGSVRVAASFAGDELVYRIDEVRFQGDFQHRLLVPAGVMLGDRIAAWFAVAAAPLPAGAAAAVAPAYMIDADFEALYGDFRPGQPAAAVMAVRIRLRQASGQGGREILLRRYEQRVELKQQTPAELVRGYNLALGAILVRLAADIKALPAPG